MKRLLLSLILLLGSVNIAHARSHRSHHTTHRVEPIALPPLNMIRIAKAANRRCLASAVWHEARSENSHPINQVLVADAIISRSGLKAFGPTPCSVVAQTTRYHHKLIRQFSWSGTPGRINDLVAYKHAMDIVNKRISYFSKHPHRSPYLFFSTGRASPGIAYSRVRNIGSFHWFIPKRTVM